MKRLRIAFIVILLFSSFSTMAQQKSAGFIGIKGGISMPMGNWSKANYDDNKSGFAAPGPQVAIDGAYFFSRHIGVGGLVDYATYKTKNIKDLSAGYREAFDVDQVTTTAGNYKIWNFMPGLYFNFPVHTVSITARALGGLTYAATPDIAVDVEDADIDDGTFQQEKASQSTFGFDLGAGVTYPVIKCLAMNLGVDYFYSDPNFKIQNTDRQNNAGRLVTNYHQPLEGITVSIGVAYCFSKK